MAKNKSTNEKGANWGSLGGNTHMHGFAPTGTQKPGVSSQEGHDGGRRGIAPKAGPSDVMGFSESGNKSFAGTQTPGQSASHPTGEKNGFAKGGDTKMFGNRGSQKARPGCTAPY